MRSWSSHEHAPTRLGARTPPLGPALLDAALALMVEDGYAAVTSRRVAAKAGLKPQLVHYYFRTMDDLFVALVPPGRRAEPRAPGQGPRVAQPLRALWSFSSDPAAPPCRWSSRRWPTTVRRSGPSGRYAEEFRRHQVEALTDVLVGYGVDPDEPPAAVVAVLIDQRLPRSWRWRCVRHDGRPRRDEGRRRAPARALRGPALDEGVDAGGLGASGVPSAVDADDLAGDVARLLGHEEGARRGDVLGEPGPAHRRRLTAASMPPSPSRPLAALRRDIGVSMNPGGIVLTVIPFGANSRARDLVRPTMPDFDDT